jgi:tRNA(fMet)-specific endonuclease VapC
MRPAMQNGLRTKPRWVLDTDTVTYHQMGRAAVVQRVEQVEPGHVATSIVTMSEQIQGRLAAINRARSDPELLLSYARLQATEDYYCGILLLPFDEAAIATYRCLVNERLHVGTKDLRIAAIALANDAVLVTSNRRDFDRVPGLRIEDWNAG